VFQISASKNVEIPPSSEMILPGKIQNGFQHMVNGFIEPLDCDVMEKGCIFAKSVVDPSCQTIPIRVINLSNQSVQLYKQTTIAQCSPIKGKSNRGPIFQLITVSHKMRSLYRHTLSPHWSFIIW
jgi:hypothetical protein